ncbi:MAG: ribosomal RNA small subunit methyltransferase A [Planctomycetota bacterium]|nr:MAG: ribosomal RNA small subunit methyltransferase A [Planctomycetota bacterium]
MQTKQQIQQLLASAQVRPNKRLGQHFLIDLNLMKLLVDLADIGRKDFVLEVGCGTGSLTQALAEKAGRVVAVEMDNALAKIAERELAKAKNVEVIRADILQTKHTLNSTVTDALEFACEGHGGRLLLVANLPYNVASPVILNLITGSVKVDGMYVTVQKEVADRMTAARGKADYGTLSIVLAVTGNVKVERRLKPTVFWPQPQVDSAMVSFVRSEEKTRCIASMDLFTEVVSLFMGHRRKMLKSCTKSAVGSLAEIGNWQDIFKRLSIDPRNRPQQVSPEEYVAISNACYAALE